MAAIEAILEPVATLTAELGALVGRSGGGSGADGEDGATFTPAVAADGTLSWTNDKGLANPEPVNIMGPQGPQGPQGEPGQLDDSLLEDYLPKRGGTMTGALQLGNNVPIYVGTAGGSMVLLGMMNASDVMGIGSANYPLAIHGQSITLDNLQVSDAVGARANLAVPGRPILLWWGTVSAAAGTALTVAASGGSAGCTGLGNISDYKTLLFVHDAGMAYEVINNGTHLYGGGNYYDISADYAYAFGMAAALSGNTLTITANKYLNLSHSERKTGNVWDNFTEIYGIIKTGDIITA